MQENSGTKKRLLVLVGEYKPYMSPNGKIISLLNQEFKDKYDITVLTRKTHFALKNFEKNESETIIRVEDYNAEIHHWIEKKQLRANNLLERKLWNAVLLIKRVWFWIPRVFRKASVSSWFVKKEVRAIQQIAKKQKVDLVLAASSPHEEIFAANDWCATNHCPFYIYQMDRFVNGNSLYPTKIFRKRQQENNRKLEERAINTCKALFVLPPIFEYYGSHRYDQVKNKIIVTEHPLVSCMNMQKKRKNEGGKVIVTYAGSLDQTLRNPEYLLQIFGDDEIRKSCVYLSLYTFGNCENMISQHCEENDHVRQNGKIPSNAVEGKLQESNILVTIGNNSDSEVPSKLFQYLSFGKPIIHLYYSDQDKYIDYLKRYPLALVLKMDPEQLEDNIRRFKDFCITYRDAEIANREVVALYRECTPQFVAEQFLHEMRN